MDYLFENLGDDRFQEFCSVLISKEFPHVQAFPVNQPDGGRDAIAYQLDNPRKTFIVFQVKYVVNPKKETDIHKWLTEIIKKEAPKIDKLIPKGATQYYLITNATGTAHKDTGSKDKVNKILEQYIKIPSICWWRDDLARLFEKDPMFKWSFPQVLNGQDILNSILFSNLNDNKERKENIMKAYLADQYLRDNEVKFKQVELQNNIFDLFVDVPLVVKAAVIKDKTTDNYIVQQFKENNTYEIDDEGNYIEYESNTFAADFFLNYPSSRIERMLLEGGPGQGKSTISQYICQVHRARLLNKDNDISKLSDSIANSPIKIPIKIDLRNISDWVDGVNPYQNNEEATKNKDLGGLEAFLVAHINHFSGIPELKSSDLITIFKLSSILLVFDGFDEIANIKLRGLVVDFINKGLNRLTENAYSINVLVTSRPAAFTDEVDFSVDSYPHFELANLTPEVTNQYVDKWISANHLSPEESAEIRRLVTEKLKLSHLKELAKSPMQLAIFVSLLRRKGESLPNKRTALYDSYIDLFFDRESEKNTLIRDNRDLVIEIHQYLGWVLHSEAETNNNNGIVTLENLIEILNSFLMKEGHKIVIAEQLFNVMKERVCALVSRKQGTYEFEVQPLREYFCAKYLYNTAQYSPPGKEKPGTLPDRFDAVSRNLYWQNVVRFFSGCFSKGDLPLLIYKLKELHSDEHLKFTNYPTVLTLFILSDRVFSQYPKLLEEAVIVILEALKKRTIVSQNNEIFKSSLMTAIPFENGGELIINECFDQLKQIPNYDYANELLEIITGNLRDIMNKWIDNIINLDDDTSIIWLLYASRLRIIHFIKNEFLLEVVKMGSYIQIIDKIKILKNYSKVEVIDSDPLLKSVAYSGVINGLLNSRNGFDSQTPLSYLSAILNIDFFINVTKEEIHYYSLLSSSNSYQGHDYAEVIRNYINSKDDENPIHKFLNSTYNSLNVPSNEWQTDFDLWNGFIENFQIHLGLGKSIYIIAIIGANVKFKISDFTGSTSLEDINYSLFTNILNARIKSSDLKYWNFQLETVKDKSLLIMVFFTWAKPKIIIELIDKINLELLNLTVEEFLCIYRVLKPVIKVSPFNISQRIELKKIMTTYIVSQRFFLIMSLRFPSKEMAEYTHRFINIDNFENISSIKLNYLCDMFIERSNNINLLIEIKNYYTNSPSLKKWFTYRGKFRYKSFIKINIDSARQIMTEPIFYPRFIVSIAEANCQIYAIKKSPLVGDVAKEQNWFS